MTYKLHSVHKELTIETLVTCTLYRQFENCNLKLQL